MNDLVERVIYHACNLPSPPSVPAGSDLNGLRTATRRITQPGRFAQTGRRQPQLPLNRMGRRPYNRWTPWHAGLISAMPDATMQRHGPRNTTATCPGNYRTCSQDGTYWHLATTTKVTTCWRTGPDKLTDGWIRHAYADAAWRQRVASLGFMLDVTY